MTESMLSKKSMNLLLQLGNHINTLFNGSLEKKIGFGLIIYDLTDQTTFQSVANISDTEFQELLEKYIWNKLNKKKNSEDSKNANLH